MQDGCKKIIEFVDGLVKGEIPTIDEELRYEKQVRLIVQIYYEITDGHDIRTTIETVKKREGGTRMDVFSYNVGWTGAIMNALNRELFMSNAKRRECKAAQYIASGERMLLTRSKAEIFVLPMFFRMLVVARLRAKHCLEFTKGARSVTKRARSTFLDAVGALGAAFTVGKYSKADDVKKHFPAEVQNIAFKLKIIMPPEKKKEMRNLKASKGGLARSSTAAIQDEIISMAKEMKESDPKMSLSKIAANINHKLNSCKTTDDDDRDFEAVERDIDLPPF
jgi:hypothetical protein